MDICDVAPLSPACLPAGVAGTLAGAAANSVLDSVGDAFARAVETVLDATFEAISSVSTVDLTSSYVGRNVAVLTSVALVIIVGLFVVVDIGSVWGVALTSARSSVLIAHGLWSSEDERLVSVLDRSVAVRVVR